MKLKKLVQFTPGINPSRINQDFLEKYSFYDKESFERDLIFESVENSYKNNITDASLLEDEIIFYGLSNQMAIVSKSNEGKIPSLNFSKVEIISDKIDRYYLLYIFNENQMIQRQIERKRQGMLLLKLSLSSLYDIDIPIIPIEDQKKIGEIYKNSIILKNKIKKYSELLETASMHLLSMKVREKYDNGKDRKK